MNRLTNKLIGNYELLDPVATTGLATVYRAQDNTSGKIVALKVVHAYFVREAEGLQRYLRQMARVQELRHPNIVPVYGVEHNQESLAVVMEYMEWPTLKVRKPRKMPLGEVLTILGQVAAALDYAHANGLVHQDLRPSNVFYDEESGRAMVSDFGTIALAEGGHLLLRSTINTPAPSYAAPEQLQGQPPDPRNDVYSLGALAYELLTGEVPFDALSPYTILSRQLSTNPDPPSFWNVALPVAVDTVVLKALKRRPEERYPTCGAMVEALTQAAGPSVVAKAVTSSTHASGTHAPGTALAPARGEEVAIAWDREDARVICPRCGSGNSATASRCQTCWGTLGTQPVVTREEERRWVRKYVGRLRLRRRVLWGVPGVMAAVLLGVWAYNLLNITPPLPAPTTTVTTSVAAGDWPTIQRDLLHTGVVPGPAFAPQGAPQRIFQSDGPILATPAVAGNKIYVATSDLRVAALDRATGQILWTHTVSGPVNSAPTVAGSLVYVGLRAGDLLALDTETGKLKWSYQTKNPIYGSATVVDGTLYIGSGDHFLYALDADTGKLRWKTETGEWILATPTVSQGIAVIGSQDGELYLADVSKGTLRYQVNLGASMDTAITVVDNVAYFTTRVGNVLAFDYMEKDVSFRKAKLKIQTQLFVWGMRSSPPRLPGLVWSRRLREQIVAEMATAHGRLFLATVAGKLHALDTKTGLELWKVEGLARLYSAPIVSGDTVIQTASDGTIYGFAAATGIEKWRASVREGVTTSVILAGDTLYVPTTAGNLYAIR
ncbi:MAG: serine/threonine-protein kinase [Dehalococcoidia bacterium]|nr:serine/threonine-protein kinase [Dehalococcoidia bacterium]